jgi:hypothetical protein
VGVSKQQELCILSSHFRISLRYIYYLSHLSSIDVVSNGCMFLA